MAVSAVVETLQIGVLLLISVSLLVALLVVWRDDHKWIYGREF